MGDTEKNSHRHAFEGANKTAVKKSLKVARVGMLFCVCYFLTYIFLYSGVLYNIVTGGRKWPHWLTTLSYISGPLQGFFNAFVYAYRTDACHVWNYFKRALQRCKFENTTSEIVICK